VIVARPSPTAGAPSTGASGADTARTSTTADALDDAVWTPSLAVHVASFTVRSR
jgi:hypothetical protein